MDVLRNLRKNRKKTQQQMAEYLGITQQAYATYENNRAQPPADMLSKLADFFGVSIDYLLGREEKPLNIPKEYQELPVAFYEGAEGLNQDDIDDVVNFMEYLKNKKNK